MIIEILTSIRIILRARFGFTNIANDHKFVSKPNVDCLLSLFR